MDGVERFFIALAALGFAGLFATLALATSKETTT
jgi:hypothetical protein